MCRICFGMDESEASGNPADQLISPCKCSGETCRCFLRQCEAYTCRIACTARISEWCAQPVQSSQAGISNFLQARSRTFTARACSRGASSAVRSRASDARNSARCEYGLSVPLHTGKLLHNSSMTAADTDISCVTLCFASCSVRVSASCIAQHCRISLCAGATHSTASPGRISASFPARCWAARCPARGTACRCCLPSCGPPAW